MAETLKFESRWGATIEFTQLSNGDVEIETESSGGEVYHRYLEPPESNQLEDWLRRRREQRESTK